MDGQIPLLIQWDERWGYAPYGTSVVAVSGCGPTCMAMVAAGLRHDPTITPAKVAEYGTQNQYVDEENKYVLGFYAGGRQELGAFLLQRFFVRRGTFGRTFGRASGHLQYGARVFTQNGHFIVMTGYENGQIRINDPFSTENPAGEPGHMERSTTRSRLCGLPDRSGVGKTRRRK